MKLIVLLQFPMIVTKCDSYKTNLEPRPRRERRRRARLASVLILRTLRKAIITFLKRRKLHHELWEERRHWIMVFGGYADDLRTRPSAITSLSKMPRIRVLVIGHGRPRELARSLNASAFLITYLVELPTSRLLARNNLRIAPAILNPRTRLWRRTQNCPRPPSSPPFSVRSR